MIKEKSCETFLSAQENVNIAVSSSDEYVPILIVCLYSLSRNTSINRKYNITILQTDISPENQKRIYDSLGIFTNIYLRFLDLSHFLMNYTVRIESNISLQTYFRLLLPLALPDWEKAVYLDSDIVVLQDVGQLFDEDLNSNYLLATHDADGTAQFNGSLAWMKNYGKRALHLQNQTNYFQAGVLVMNLTQLRSDFSLDILKTMIHKNYVYFDQDILNILCEGKVGFIDMRWNVMMDCGGGRIKDVCQYAPHAFAEAYQQARKDPWIIHFAGEPKPWQKENVDYGTIFWRYAKECNEAPLLYSGMINALGISQEPYYTNAHQFMSKVSLHCPICRLFINTICPQGSFCYKHLRDLYHKIQMKKKYWRNHW